MASPLPAMPSPLPAVSGMTPAQVLEMFSQAKKAFYRSLSQVDRRERGRLSRYFRKQVLPARSPAAAGRLARQAARQAARRAANDTSAQTRVSETRVLRMTDTRSSVVSMRSAQDHLRETERELERCQEELAVTRAIAIRLESLDRSVFIRDLHQKALASDACNCERRVEDLFDAHEKGTLGIMLSRSDTGSGHGNLWWSMEKLDNWFHDHIQFILHKVVILAGEEVRLEGDRLRLLRKQRRLFVQQQINTI